MAKNTKGTTAYANHIMSRLTMEQAQALGDFSPEQLHALSACSPEQIHAFSGISLDAVAVLNAMSAFLSSGVASRGSELDFLAQFVQFFRSIGGKSATAVEDLQNHGDTMKGVSHNYPTHREPSDAVNAHAIYTCGELVYIMRNAPQGYAEIAKKLGRTESAIQQMYWRVLREYQTHGHCSRTDFTPGQKRSLTFAVRAIMKRA